MDQEVFTALVEADIRAMRARMADADMRAHPAEQEGDDREWQELTRAEKRERLAELDRGELIDLLLDTLP